MDELRKKILLDLFVTPATVLPITGGVSLLLLSVVTQPLLGFLGFCSVLAGVGVAATNFFFRFDEISKKVIEQTKRKKAEEREMELDRLDVALSSDRDPRDQTALRNLRSLCDTFTEDVRKGIVSGLAGSMIHQDIEEIFNHCLDRLRFQHELWQTSRKVEGQPKTDLLKQKSEVMDEVEASVKCVSEIISEARVLGMKGKKDDLAKLRDRLRDQLESAKNAEKILDEIVRPSTYEYQNG